MRIRTDIDPAAILRSRGLGDSTKARVYFASAIKRMSDPYVPMASGSGGGTLKNTAIVAEDGSKITYPGPYAHYQYHGEVMAGRAPKQYTGAPIQYHGAPMRGKEWDKRMMADHRDEIMDGLARYVGGRRRT